jgi:penicillin-binding protein 2
MEDFVYQCSGGILINERTFACHNHSGHGEIGMEEAFGESCNSYFIALRQLLGYNKIAEMAKRFGYGEKIEVLGSIAAARGSFPVKSSNMSLANLSIGQGELTASPLQVAIMTAVIANGGILLNTHLYKGLYLNGKLKSEEEDGGIRIIAEEHAEKLRQYCVYAVEEGTGKHAKPTYGSAGGKTASAQTGIIENGIERLNVYFTGFYPAENPQYVITVFAENGTSGGKTCGPVFSEMCDFIAQRTK